MIQLFNDDNLNVMATLPDGSIDVVCIDPPYLYLKGHKLDRPFDEQKFFLECYRLLTDKGFIVLFGRGESFYRWNTMLCDLGLKFKEEIVWDKGYTSSPLMSIGRMHETVAIYSKGSGTINKVKVPYVEAKQHNIDSIVTDIKRLISGINNPASLHAIQHYLESGEIVKSADCGMGASISSTIKIADQAMTIIKSIAIGLTEKTIIKEVRNHYKAIHPTEKPVRLLERLLALVIPKGKAREKIAVADFFGGSMSCMEAVHNMGMQGIAVEIDEEYYNAGKDRIDALQPAPKELFA